MASPPHPDPLSQRRKQDINDDFYDKPICPCEEVEPEPISEYEVPGEWVTYTGEINMAIFDKAAKNAKAELEKELIAYAKLERAGLASDAQPSASHSSFEPSTVPKDEYAPSAPALEELEQAEDVEVPAKKVDVDREDEVAPQEFTEDEREAYDRLAFDCKDMHEAYQEQQRQLEEARRKAKEAEEVYIETEQEANDRLAFDCENMHYAYQEEQRELEEARRKEKEREEVYIETEEEANDRLAFDCENMHYAYQEEQRQLEEARRKAKEAEEVYVISEQEANDRLAFECDDMHYKYQEQQRELEEARRKEMESQQKDNEDHDDDVIVVVIPVEDIQPKDDVVPPDFDMAELGDDDLVTVCQIIEMDEDSPTASSGRNNDIADANSPHAEIEDNSVSTEMVMEDDIKNDSSADSPSGELVIDEADSNSPLNAEFPSQGEDALSADEKSDDVSAIVADPVSVNAVSADLVNVDADAQQDAPSDGTEPQIASTENQAIVVANAPEQVAESE